MNPHEDRCCYGTGQGRSPAIARRSGAAASWVLPACVLALMPKCPACVAAYVALATGLGISVSAAAALRTGAIAACVATLLYLAARAVRRRVVAS